MPSIAQIAAQVRHLITEVQAEEVDEARRGPQPPRIVDVREQSEWDAGHIPGAELIPLGTVAQVAAEKMPDKSERKVLHSTERIGEPKVESAKRTLEALNPDVNVVGYRERLEAGNIDKIIADYDVIVDGADNFPTRYLLNDASVKWRKPVVHGSIYRFEGQVTVFKPFEGPCYRCLFHEPPPPELAPSCAEAGVLGVLPGVIGTIQANETIKLLLGIGEPLIGRYLLFDALEGSFREVRLRRDPACPVCGEHPTITDYIDYEGFCASPAQWRAERAPAKVSTPAD